MYTPVDVKTLQRNLQQLYMRSAVMTEPRLSMILFALALGALFRGQAVPRTGQTSSFTHAANQQPQQRPTYADPLLHAHDAASLPGKAPGYVADKLQSQRIFQLGFSVFLRQSSNLSIFAPCVWESAVSAHLAVSYLLSCGQADTSHAAWQVLGSGIRMAVSMGLHCSQSTWNLPPEQIAAHSRVWWELQAYERLQSLNFGRPSCLPEYVGCRPPFVLAPGEWQTVQPNPETFHAIKYQLGPLYAKINQLLSKDEAPAIAQVMAIDAEIRAFMVQVPSWLLLDEDHASSQRSHERSANASTSLSPDLTGVQGPHHILPQKHMLSLLFHKAILFLHRPFFCKATHNGNEPLLSPYASSFAAAVGSARQHTMLFKSALATCPSALQWWFFIFHLYTAAVLQAQVLLRCPRSMLATEVQLDLEISYSLLTTAATKSNVARRAATHIGTLRSKILRNLGAESARPASATATGGERTGLDALSEAAASSQTTHSRPSHYPPTSASGSLSAQSTAPTTLSPAGPVSLAAGIQQGDNHAWSNPSFLPFQRCRPDETQRFPLPYETVSASAYHDLSDLSAILESENLPPEIASGSEAQWNWMDPLLQTTLFWHTASGGQTD